MRKGEVMLEKLTRREFREGFESEEIKAIIFPVGSIEQHLEHLAMEHDIASSTYVAKEAALRLYPQVVVGVPIKIGISEHHMIHKGSLSTKPGSFLGVLFDACESMTRHGVKNILILNGHGGNVGSIQAAINQFLRRLNINLHFRSYWDLIPKEIANSQLESKRMPGHAQEFETAFALAAFPENVRWDETDDSESRLATAEKGKVLVETAISEVAKFVKEMIDGSVKSQITGL